MLLAPDYARPLRLWVLTLEILFQLHCHALHRAELLLSEHEAPFPPGQPTPPLDISFRRPQDVQQRLFTCPTEGLVYVPLTGFHIRETKLTFRE